MFLHEFAVGALKHQDAIKMFATILYISNRAYRRYKTQYESFQDQVVHVILTVLQSRVSRNDSLEQQVRDYIETIREKSFSQQK